MDRRDEVVKADLINRITKQNPELDEAVCRRLVDTFFDAMIEQLVQDRAIELRGFGSFAVKRYDERLVRNPRTGLTISKHGIVGVRFRAGKSLVASINYT
ncbi:MAG: integration host factor subunit beta [Oxalobacteraceae bacterium]|nr:MAG: integration host factor subunit beta [Oxalobacteraceae bacterium]